MPSPDPTPHPSAPFQPERLLRALRQRPLVMDAAMGTRLMASGLDLDRDDASLWNLSNPDRVLGNHEADVLAGADVLVTNTFGANREWLSRFGRGEPFDLVAINRRAVELAKLAAGPERFVVGSLGPTILMNGPKPGGQIKALLVAGVDAFLLETFTFEAALRLLEVIRDRTVIPILVSLHTWPADIGEAAKSLRDAGADVVGVNCTESFSVLLDTVRKLRDAIDLPLLAKPSGGRPGGPSYSPDDFAVVLPELLECNVRLYGGCCGTTDAHVRAIRRSIGS